MRALVVLPSILLGWAIAAWAQLPGTASGAAAAVAAAPASPGTVTVVQIVVLVSAMLGSFLAYMSHADAVTLSWRAAGSVIFSGCATYLAMVSGYIPQSVFDAAGSALTAGVSAVLISGVAGAVLVEAFRKVMGGVQNLKGGQ